MSPHLCHIGMERGNDTDSYIAYQQNYLGTGARATVAAEPGRSHDLQGAANGPGGPSNRHPDPEAAMFPSRAGTGLRQDSSQGERYSFRHAYRGKATQSFPSAPKDRSVIVGGGGLHVCKCVVRLERNKMSSVASILG